MDEQPKSILNYTAEIDPGLRAPLWTCLMSDEARA